MNQQLLIHKNPEFLDNMLMYTWNSCSAFICQERLGGGVANTKIMASPIVVPLLRRVNSVSEDVTHDRADGVRNVSHVLSRSTFHYLEALIDEAIWASCVERYIRKETGPETRDAEIPVCAVTHRQDLWIYCGSLRSNKWHKYAKKPKGSTFPCFSARMQRHLTNSLISPTGMHSLLARNPRFMYYSSGCNFL